MTTVFLLLALMAVFCLIALVGAMLLITRLFKAKRPARAGIIVFAGSLLGLAGCFACLLVTVFNKVKAAGPGHYWQAMAAAAFDDTAVPALNPTLAKQILTGKLANAAFLRGADVKGVWVDGIALSHGYFLYSADEQSLLSAVASAPVDPTFHLASDSACREIPWSECKERLMYKNGPQGNIAGWAPQAVTEKRCYSCLRCPWLHTILIDKETGTVYHAISEIRD